MLQFYVFFLPPSSFFLTVPEIIWVLEGVLHICNSPSTQIVSETHFQAHVVSLSNFDLFPFM